MLQKITDPHLKNAQVDRNPDPNHFTFFRANVTGSDILFGVVPDERHKQSMTAAVVAGSSLLQRVCSHSLFSPEDSGPVHVLLQLFSFCSPFFFVIQLIYGWMIYASEK